MILEETKKEPFSGYILPYEEQRMRDEIVIFWNLMGLFAQMSEMIPEHDRLIEAQSNLRRLEVLIPYNSKTETPLKEEVSPSATEVVSLKRWCWQWHDSTGPWRILEITWGYGPKSRSLVYTDPYELPLSQWPPKQHYDKVYRDTAYYRTYGRFREDDIPLFGR